MTKDPAFDTMKIGKPKRIPIDEFTDDSEDYEPLPLEDLADSLVIMDDIDCVGGKGRSKGMQLAGERIQLLMNQILTMGRKHRISLFVICHKITNGHHSIVLLAESKKFILFPTFTNKANLDRICINYLGLSREVVKGLKEFGRWVCISNRSVPAYLLGEHQLALL